VNSEREAIRSLRSPSTLVSSLIWSVMFPYPAL